MGFYIICRSCTTYNIAIFINQCTIFGHGTDNFAVCADNIAVVVNISYNFSVIVICKADSSGGQLIALIVNYCAVGSCSADYFAVKVANKSFVVNITHNLSFVIVYNATIYTVVGHGFVGDYITIFVNATDYLTIGVNNRTVRHNNANNIAVFVNSDLSGFCDASQNTAGTVNNLTLVIKLSYQISFGINNCSVGHYLTYYIAIVVIDIAHINSFADYIAVHIHHGIVGEHFSYCIAV